MTFPSGQVRFTWSDMFVYQKGLLSRVVRGLYELSLLSRVDVEGDFSISWGVNMVVAIESMELRSQIHKSRISKR